MKKYRHIMLLEVETDDPDLDSRKLQEEVLALLEPLIAGTAAVVEDRQVIGIHRKNP